MGERVAGRRCESRATRFVELMDAGSNAKFFKTEL